jgi:hypothetical protein
MKFRKADLVETDIPENQYGVVIEVKRKRFDEKGEFVSVLFPQRLRSLTGGIHITTYNIQDPFWAGKIRRVPEEDVPPEIIEDLTSRYDKLSVLFFRKNMHPDPLRNLAEIYL